MQRDRRLTGILISVFGLVMILTISTYAVIGGINPDSSSLILRVVPHSDRPLDQDLKLKVRDDLVIYLNGHIDPSDSIQKQLQLLLPEINAVVEERMAIEGFDMTFTSEIVPMDNPPNSIKLEVTLGEGKGANFWCVIFPNMCFIPEVTEITENNRTVHAAEPGIQPINMEENEEDRGIIFKWFFFERWKETQAYKLWEHLWVAKTP